MINKAKKEYSNEIFDVLKQSWLETYVPLGIDKHEIIKSFKSKSVWVKKFNDFLDLKDSISYIKKTDNKIIGIIFGNKNNIQSLYILKKYQNKGFGSKLLNKYIKSYPCKIHVLNCNKTALKFYISHGFKPTGKYSYYSIGNKKYKNLEMIKMEK